MMLKRTLYILLITVSVYTVRAQEETNVVPFSLETQNWVKFNRNFINPTFSLVREKSTYLSLFNRNESVDFDDNVNTYILNYSGKANETTGIGVGLFQQNRGIFRYYGATANYAHGFNFGENTQLSLGANLSYFRSDLRSTDIIADPADPTLFGREELSIINFQPGINLSVGAFDIGVYAENLVDYDLKNNESLSQFADKTFSGHLMYTQDLDKNNTLGFFEDASMKLLARGRKIGELDLSLSGNLILDLPKIGWLQAGYDEFYGGAVGLGLNLTKNISIGYNIEKAFSGDRSNLGATHELSLAYRFDPVIEKGLIAEEEEEKNPLKEEAALATSTREMQELKDNMAVNMQMLEDFLTRQDSINEANDARFNRLMDMLASMQAQNQNGRDGKDGRDGSKIVTTTPTNTTAVRKPRPVAKPKTSTPKKRKGAVVINGVDEGYYLIANVYKENDNRYFTKFYNELKDKGLEPGYFVNPRNGLKYVYLRNHDNRKEAIDSYKSKLDNTYHDELWIMDVVNDTDLKVAQKSGPKYQFNSVVKSSNSKKSVSSYNNTPKITETKTVETKKLKTKKTYTAATSNRKKITKPTVMNASGVDGGFYIVANVFSKKSYADKFVKKLKDSGLEAAYFINPDNNFRYVYLKKLNTWNNALTSYYSNVDNTYFDNVWIMRVNALSI